MSVSLPCSQASCWAVIGMSPQPPLTSAGLSAAAMQARLQKAFSLPTKVPRRVSTNSSDTRISLGTGYFLSTASKVVLFRARNSLHLAMVAVVTMLR